MHSETIISFEQVIKTYPGKLAAIKQLSFSICRGEFVFLAGHSGAGKSTLLRLIAGIEKATAGTVIVNHVNLQSFPKSELPYLRQSIGLIFQDHKILYDRSVADNVILPLEIQGMPENKAKGRVRAALYEVGLIDKKNLNPISLSGGEQQRLCIARAIVNSPMILLADEPTGNLDRQYAQDIMELFKRFNTLAKTTIIISTHDEDLMREYGQRVIRLQQGSLV